jgi:hypothetical protein
MMLKLVKSSVLTRLAIQKPEKDTAASSTGSA